MDTLKLIVGRDEWKGKLEIAEFWLEDLELELEVMRHTDKEKEELRKQILTANAEVEYARHKAEAFTAALKAFKGKSVDELAWEVQAYGETEAELILGKSSMYGPIEWAMSLLSDAQSQLEFSASSLNGMKYVPARDAKIARQWMNQAKYWMGNALEAEREAKQEAK